MPGARHGAQSAELPPLNRAVVTGGGGGGGGGQLLRLAPPGPGSTLGLLCARLLLPGWPAVLAKYLARARQLGRMLGEVGSDATATPHAHRATHRRRGQEQ